MKQSDLRNSRKASHSQKDAPEGITISGLQDQFYYFRPVPVFVEVVQDPDNGAIDCDALPTKPKVAKKASVAIPQLSDHFVLPIGSGVFESKAVSAEFTKEGRIVSISYSGSGSGSGVAEALAGGLIAGQTLRDAELVETKRKID